MSKLIIVLVSLLYWNPAFANEDQTEEEKPLNNLVEYEGLKERGDRRAEGKVAGMSDMYTNAVKEYSDQMYSKAKKEAKRTFDLTRSDLRKMWNGKPSDKRVPNSFIKKFLENKISQKSLDTLILALSGMNAVSDCELVKLAPLKGSTLSKLAPPLHGEAYEKVNGLGKISNGYVEPHSHHFFRAASAIYVLGIMNQQHLYDFKIDYLREIKNQSAESYQEKMLRVNIELNLAAKHYVEKQIELKKLYKKMISSAAKMAEDETSSKATRVAYRGKRRDKAAKDYDKKKKIAAATGSDHAAREAVKAYEIHRLRKYEHEVSQVHTHIGCDVIKDTEATASINFLDILFSRAFATEGESPLYNYYLEMSKEQNQATNKSMINPENRVKFLLKNSIETVDIDISDVTPSLNEFDSNIKKLQSVYDNFTEDQGESMAENKAKIKKAFDAGTPQFKGFGANLTSVGTDDSTAAFGNFDAGTAGGNLGNAGSLKNAFARLAKADDKFRRVEYKNPDGGAKESYLSSPEVPTLDEIKKKALENLTDAQKLALDAAFKGNLGSAPNVEATEDEEGSDEKKAGAINIAKKTKKTLNLPDINDDPALKLLRKKPKLVKLKKDEDVDVVNPDSLKALEEGATDINDNRETTLWVIISNRYVRSGFERLLEKKN